MGIMVAGGFLLSEERGRSPWELRAALQGRGLALRGGVSPTDLTFFGIWELELS